MTSLGSEEERAGLIVRIKWLLFLRVLILTFFIGAVAVAYLLKGGGESLSILHSLQFPLIGAYLFSLVSALLLRRVSNLGWFSHLQVNFDVILVTGIVWITGDLHSPFPFLYNLAVLNGSILLFHRGAFTTAAFSSFCYGGLIFGVWFYSPPNEVSRSELIMSLALNIPSFFLIAFLGGFLARRLYEAEELLKKKQRDYLDLEALKEALLQGIGSGIAITDLKGRVDYLNAHAQALTALSEDRVRRKNLAEIFPGLTYDFKAAQEARRVFVDEFAYAAPHSTQKRLRLTLAPLSDPENNPIGHVAIFEDVTKQRELEEKVRFEEEMRRARERELAAPAVNHANGSFLFEGVVGNGGGMDKIYHLIRKIAGTTTNVLITGESGTGKELVARAVHANGPRKDRPFVAVNCGAIPENLIESELLGHVRGAFTGAVSDHDGLFKQANGGTIFLDEVGELPLHLQVKLLRVLQEKAFTPVGGNKAIKVDVRVISASNKDLRKEVERGRFREDLYYRLNVVHIALPPLRNRKDDVPLLSEYFVKKYAGSFKKEVEEISSDAFVYLMNYAYPGNIRELENIIEHAVAVTGRNILTEEDLPSYMKGTPISVDVDVFEKTAPEGADFFFNKGISLDEEIATHEKCLLLGALKKVNGVQKKAAELLGINYRSFRHRLEKYGLLGLKNYQVAVEAEEDHEQ